MKTATKTWEIYAIRHAANTIRTRGVNYISDPDPQAPLAMAQTAGHR